MFSHKTYSCILPLEKPLGKNIDQIAMSTFVNIHKHRPAFLLPHSLEMFNWKILANTVKKDACLFIVYLKKVG